MQMVQSWWSRTLSSPGKAVSEVPLTCGALSGQPTSEQRGVEGDMDNYTRWILVDSPEDFDWDEVVFDGFGYVVLRDGSRLDVKPDLYEAERRQWNTRSSA
jgi:hypothetical protein